jgi:alkylated DNA repair protein (DNA oxidative demethylase)
MHADRDERSDAPVVSISVGDTGVFRFGTPGSRGRPHRDVDMRSGDLVVFGGPARHAYHGVPRIRPGTGDPRTGLGSGRLNLTLRVTGLVARP